MKLRSILLSLLLCSAFLGCSQEVTTETKTIQPLRLNLEYLSGLGLDAVKNPKQPDRKLFQKNLYRGPEISIYVVSSESATFTHESYGIDEFLYLINGGARIKPNKEEDQFYYTGDFFIVPKGYHGEWETIGGTNFHHELSIISTPRNRNTLDPKKSSPQLLDKRKISGISITKLNDTAAVYLDTLYAGHEITTLLHAQSNQSLQVDQFDKEQMIYIVAGSLKLTDTSGETHSFFAGDFFLLPKDFKGIWESRGHHLFRWISVEQSDWIAVEE